MIDLTKAAVIKRQVTIAKGSFMDLHKLEWLFMPAIVTAIEVFALTLHCFEAS